MFEWRWKVSDTSQWIQVGIVPQSWHSIYGENPLRFWNKMTCSPLESASVIFSSKVDVKCECIPSFFHQCTCRTSIYISLVLIWGKNPSMSAYFCTQVHHIVERSRENKFYFSRAPFQEFYFKVQKMLLLFSDLSEVNSDV